MDSTLQLVGGNILPAHSTSHAAVMGALLKCVGSIECVCQPQAMLRIRSSFYMSTDQQTLGDSSPVGPCIPPLGTTLCFSRQ